MSWYDVFSRFYDLSTERIYRSVREKVFAHLETEGVSSVLDLACGTGQNFPHLIARLGPEVRLVGIDGSAGMLERARTRVRRNGWGNVSLVEADARTVSRDRVLERQEISTERDGVVDCVVTTLALEALPEWERVVDETFTLLRPGGQWLSLGVWAERRVPQTLCIEAIARADLRRRTWEPLERACDRFTLESLPGSPHVHGGRLFMASGFRPGSAVPSRRQPGD